MSIIGKITDCGSEMVINGAAVATGAVTSIYCLERDPANDPELSAIIGVTTGALTGSLVKYVGTSIKARVLGYTYNRKISKNARKAMKI